MTLVVPNQIAMTGEFNFGKFSSFLKSFWGLLASISVTLPTIIYFLSTGQVKNSVLSEYYLGIPSTFALLVIPFVFLYEDKLSILSFARKTSITFAIFSIVFIFSFLTIKSIYISDTFYTISVKNGFEKVKYEELNTGQIRITTFSKLETSPIRVEERTNVFELVCVAVFTLSIILLTASFSALGVFFYTKASSNKLNGG